MSVIAKPTRAIEVIPANSEVTGTKEEHKPVPEQEVDPVELQSELKERMRMLDRLVKEGNNTKDIDELRTILTATISELDEILEDPDLAAFEEIQ